MKQKFIEKINRPYLKKVDIVSIDSWFEVSGKRNPSYEEVKQSLFATTVYNRGQNVVQQLNNYIMQQESLFILVDLTFQRVNLDCKIRGIQMFLMCFRKMYN